MVISHSQVLEKNENAGIKGDIKKLIEMDPGLEELFRV